MDSCVAAAAAVVVGVGLVAALVLPSVRTWNRWCSLACHSTAAVDRAEVEASVDAAAAALHLDRQSIEFAADWTPAAEPNCHRKGRRTRTTVTMIAAGHHHLSRCPPATFADANEDSRWKRRGCAWSLAAKWSQHWVEVD